MSLTFRPLRADDVDRVHELHGQPSTNAHNPYGPSVDRAASEEMLAGWLRHWEANGFGYELAFDGDRLVGICGARRDVWLGQEVINLYWRLLDVYWGRGLAASLGERALDIATALPTDGRPIVARMVTSNVASRRVAERLGLRRRSELDGDAAGVRWIVFAYDGIRATA